MHLDLQGVVGTTAEFHSRGLLQSGAWQLTDPAGRGPLPDLTQETGIVIFEDGHRCAPATAQELARDVSQPRLPLVVLNACESALVPPGSGDSALASHLVEAGGFSALGSTSRCQYPVPSGSSRLSTSLWWIPRTREPSIKR